jgi:uncharacterized protein HemX
VIVLGLILLTLCVVLGAGIALSNTDPATAEAFGVSLQGVSIGGLFLLGVAVGAVAMLGVGLTLAGAARKRAKRKARKRERHERTSLAHERESLAEENARLHSELERSAPDVYPSEGEHGRSGTTGKSRR